MKDLELNELGIMEREEERRGERSKGQKLNRNWKANDVSIWGIFRMPQMSV